MGKGQRETWGLPRSERCKMRGGFGVIKNRAEEKEERGTGGSPQQKKNAPF